MPSAIVSAELVGDGLARRERQGIGGRLFGDDADDLRAQAERVARRDHAADARAQPDRHVDRVERAGAAE